MHKLFPYFVTSSKLNTADARNHLRVCACPPEIGMEMDCRYDSGGKLAFKIERQMDVTSYYRYRFDEKGHLDAVNLNDDPEERYEYEWFGKRVASWTKTHGHKSYFYNVAGQLVRVRSMGGKRPQNQAQRYIFSGGSANDQRYAPNGGRASGQGYALNGGNTRGSSGSGAYKEPECLLLSFGTPGRYSNSSGAGGYHASSNTNGHSSNEPRITEYTYAQDGSLRGKITETGASTFYYDAGRLNFAELEGGKQVKYEYEPNSPNPQGPTRKYVNGVLAEEYAWHDLVHLAACVDYRQGLYFEFEYDALGTLHAITISTLPPELLPQEFAGERVSAERLFGYAGGGVGGNRTSGSGANASGTSGERAGNAGVSAAKACSNTTFSQKYICGLDQVGSLRFLKARGVTIKAMGYDSFGNIKDERGADLHLPIGFAGGLRDSDTGLVRFGFRDYDAEVGRFTCLDPLGDTGGDHDLYDYCVDDPVSARDETGLLLELAADNEEPSEEDIAGARKIGNGFMTLWSTQSVPVKIVSRITGYEAIKMTKLAATIGDTLNKLITGDDSKKISKGLDHAYDEIGQGLRKLPGQVYDGMSPMWKNIKDTVNRHYGDDGIKNKNE